jgi:hypothetical protein
MASTEISSVDETLKTLLYKSISADPTVKALISSPDQITFCSPKEAEKQQGSQLSIFLYNVTLNQSSRNAPTLNTSGQHVLPPLRVDLHYLFTPISKDPKSSHIIITKIMQTLEQTPIIPENNIAITMEQLSTDDLNKLWTIIVSPYKLSLSYKVAGLEIQLATKQTQPALKQKTKSK